MSYGKLNIWIRWADCSLVKRQYTGLVIKTCSGQYVADMDPKIVEKLKERYPNFEVDFKEVTHYGGEKDKWITIESKKEPIQSINHIEVDLPPGSYVVWTHIVGCGNIETNKAMVTVNCGDECCVNLLLNSVEACGRQFLEPLIIRALGPRQELDPDVLRAVNVVGRIAGIPQERIETILNSRIEYLDRLNELDLRTVEIKELKKARNAIELIKANIDKINLK